MNKTLPRHRLYEGFPIPNEGDIIASTFFWQGHYFTNQQYAGICDSRTYIVVTENAITGKGAPPCANDDSRGIAHFVVEKTWYSRYHEDHPNSVCNAIACRLNPDGSYDENNERITFAMMNSCDSIHPSKITIVGSMKRIYVNA